MPIDTTNWTHIAATMNATPGQGGKKYDKITFYVNGVKAAENSGGHTFPWFLNRAAGVGMHGVFLAGDADGLVYEPRISVGVLKPFNSVKRRRHLYRHRHDQLERFKPPEFRITGRTRHGRPIGFFDNFGFTADLVLSNPRFTGAGAGAYSVTILPGPIVI